MISEEDFNNNTLSNTTTFSVPANSLHVTISSPYKLSTQPDFYTYVTAIFLCKLYILAATTSSALMLTSASSTLAPQLGLAQTIVVLNNLQAIEEYIDLLYT